MPITQSRPSEQRQAKRGQIRRTGNADQQSPYGEPTWTSSKSHRAQHDPRHADERDAHASDGDRIAKRPDGSNATDAEQGHEEPGLPKWISDLHQIVTAHLFRL